MRLDSVRGLKAELKEPAVVPRALVRALGARVQPTPALAMRFDAAHTRDPRSNVVALGVSRGRGARDFRLGVRIQVANPRRASTLADDFRRQARGEADVRIVPRVRKRARRTGAWFQRRRRPLEAGLSVGHVDISAGTLGFVVEDDDAYYVLSNNHVLANVNAGQPGDPVVQPGPDDMRASDRTVIGVLDRFVPISFRRSNVVDAAVAEIFEHLEFFVGRTSALTRRVNGTRAIGPEDLGLAVTKAGRTTGVTRGTITQVEVDRLSVDLGDPPVEKIALFSDQFEVVGDDGRPFSLPGDSGSLIVDRRGRALGLLFSGGPDDEGTDLTFANRIDVVLDKLGVTLAL